MEVGLSQRTKALPRIHRRPLEVGPLELFVEQRQRPTLSELPGDPHSASFHSPGGHVSWASSLALSRSPQLCQGRIYYPHFKDGKTEA